MVVSSQTAESRTRVENNIILHICAEGKALTILIHSEGVVEGAVTNVKAPKGFTGMPPEEGAWAWRTSPMFRQVMHGHLVWTGRLGLESSGDCKIEVDGGSKPISGEEYAALGIAERSMHRAGDARVSLGGVYDNRGEGLLLDARPREGHRLWVAFVKFGDLGDIANTLRIGGE